MSSQHQIQTKQSPSLQQYKSLVRPVLEYSSTVWDPAAETEIDKLEATRTMQSSQVCLNRYHNWHKTASVDPRSTRKICDFFRVKSVVLTRYLCAQPPCI